MAITTRTMLAPRWAFWVFAALFVAGIAALVVGANNGSPPDIGLLTASFLFLMGISQTGVVFCAMTRLVKAQWSKPYHRLAELSTLAFLPFAVVGFLLWQEWQEDFGPGARREPAPAVRDTPSPRDLPDPGRT
ncbi:MAG: hypothetical protein OXJ56_15595, partial [Rhodospirillaceae bacterium]|nr:hypothetical protein [Rhodospirillaceae bacterium]